MEKIPSTNFFIENRPLFLFFNVLNCGFQRVP